MSVRYAHSHFCFCAFAGASSATLQNKNAPAKPGTSICLAEREGFEPPEVLPSTVFKTAAIDRSAISPGAKLGSLARRTNIFEQKRPGGLSARQFVPLHKFLA